MPPSGRVAVGSRASERETSDEENAEPVAPPNRRRASPFRLRGVSRTPDWLPAPVVSGGR